MSLGFPCALLMTWFMFKAGVFDNAIEELLTFVSLLLDLFLFLF